MHDRYWYIDPFANATASQRLPMDHAKGLALTAGVAPLDQATGHPGRYHRVSAAAIHRAYHHQTAHGDEPLTNPFVNMHMTRRAMAGAVKGIRHPMSGWH